MIEGLVKTREVTIGPRWLNPTRSQNLFNHSPDGFAWGYGGSGPAQLALALMLEFTETDEMALRLYQDFKSEVIAGLNKDDDFYLNEEYIKNWVQVNTKLLKVQFS